MKAGFVNRQQLLKRWPDIDDGELLEILEGGKFGNIDEFYGYCEGQPKHYLFRAWHPTYKPINIHGNRMNNTNEAGQVPIAVGQIEQLFPFLQKCLFKLQEVEQVEKVKPELRNGKAEPQQDMAPAPAAPMGASPAKAPDKSYFAKIAKLGKKRSKAQPIIEAIRAYMRETPKSQKWTNGEIANHFCNKYSKNKPYNVIIDNVEWEVFCSSGIICYQTFSANAKAKDKNTEKSISISQLRNAYIPLVKKEIFPQEP